MTFVFQGIAQRSSAIQKYGLNAHLRAGPGQGAEVLVVLLLVLAGAARPVLVVITRVLVIHPVGRDLLTALVYCPLSALSAASAATAQLR